MYIKMFIVHVNMKTTEKDLKTESWHLLLHSWIGLQKCCE